MVPNDSHLVSGKEFGPIDYCGFSCPSFQFAILDLNLGPATCTHYWASKRNMTWTRPGEIHLEQEVFSVGRLPNHPSSKVWQLL